MGVSPGRVPSSGPLVRSRSPAHKTKSIRLNRKPLLDLSLMAAASYRYHPVSDLEPVAAEASSHRDAALECMKILRSVDAFMSRATDPRLAWVAISCTLELTLTNKLTEAEIARQIGVSELRVRRAVTKFTRLADIDSSGGLRAIGQIRSNGGPPSKKTAGAGSNGAPKPAVSLIGE
jgi:hypothetical protein